MGTRRGEHLIRRRMNANTSSVPSLLIAIISRFIKYHCCPTRPPNASQHFFNFLVLSAQFLSCRVIFGLCLTILCTFPSCDILLSIMNVSTNDIIIYTICNIIVDYNTTLIKVLWIFHDFKYSEKLYNSLYVLICYYCQYISLTNV